MFIRTPTPNWLIVSEYGRMVLHCNSCPKVIVLTNETKQEAINHRRSHERRSYEKKKNAQTKKDTEGLGQEMEILG